jgi:hypothetical protein
LSKRWLHGALITESTERVFLKNTLKVVGVEAKAVRGGVDIVVKLRKPRRVKK